ncbi:uncharacterized protein C2845_PM06G02010 [Panicum miliaceum]|uniref:DOG1 domain-containing protein n=1 Tax=Panicum miliaceum TaxID=4540 RepID=A0A3L6R7Q5_PANMI|nr:uncharacterized protein C2845_PM06G02010 [Panicum miliaceum]
MPVREMELEAATRRFHLWFRGLRSLRRDLSSARWSDDPAQLEALVGRFVVHLESYCAARAELDPVWTLSAPWANPAERCAAYWLAGWRPTTLVHLLYTESGRRFEAQLPDLLLGVRSGNLGDLSPAQLAQVDELQRRTVAEEDALSREMAEVQEGHGVVAPGDGGGRAGAGRARAGAPGQGGAGQGGLAAAAHHEARGGDPAAGAGGRAARRRRRHGDRLPGVRARVRIGPRPMTPVFPLEFLPAVLHTCLLDPGGVGVVSRNPVFYPPPICLCGGCFDWAFLPSAYWAVGYSRACKENNKMHEIA